MLSKYEKTRAHHFGTPQNYSNLLDAFRLTKSQGRETAESDINYEWDQSIKLHLLSLMTIN